jgi:7 transmembrane receptor (rhodopsin family)
MAAAEKRCVVSVHMQGLVFLCFTFFGASIYALVAVSIEQYCAVVHPFSVQKRRSSPLQQGLVRTFVVWVAAVAAVIPVEVFVIVAYRSSLTVMQRTYCDFSILISIAGVLI